LEGCEPISSYLGSLGKAHAPRPISADNYLAKQSAWHFSDSESDTFYFQQNWLIFFLTRLLVGIVGAQTLFTFYYKYMCTRIAVKLRIFYVQRDKTRIEAIRLQNHQTEH
jgi:hypothetical protein